MTTQATLLSQSCQTPKKKIKIIVFIFIVSRICSLVGYSIHKDCYFWFFSTGKKQNLIITQMDCEPTACVTCLPHSCSLRPGWDTDCNQTSGWELGRRHAGRQDRHLSYPLRGGKCTDITLKRAPRATFTQHQSQMFHKKRYKSCSRWQITVTW